VAAHLVALHVSRAALFRALIDRHLPIIVLVDEGSRESHELRRLVGRLVRGSVHDFPLPNISNNCLRSIYGGNKSG
jgi:hypothetical protein